MISAIVPGPAVVGIELKDRDGFPAIEARLKELRFTYQYLNDNPGLFTHLVG